jgi:hypothetical protein
MSNTIDGASGARVAREAAARMGGYWWAGGPLEPGRMAGDGLAPNADEGGETGRL